MNLPPSLMRALVLLPLLLLLGCDSGADGPPSPPGDLNPDVAPVTAGDWYRPAADVTWQWQLNGPINTGYDVELYDVDLWETADATIQPLHARGRRVLCYFSAASGVDEDRPDYGRFKDSDLGNELDGYPSERWLDVRYANVHQIMLGRLDLAALARSLSDLGRIYCGGGKSAHFPDPFRYVCTTTLLKRSKNWSRFPPHLATAPKSDRLLGMTRRLDLAEALSGSPRTAA